MKILFFALMIMFSSELSFANTYIEPGRHRVYSPNKEYFVSVNPKSSRHYIYNSKFPLLPIWSFKQPFQFDAIYLSNDGKTAFWVACRFVSEEDIKNPAVGIFKNDGSSRFFSYAQLSKPRKYFHKPDMPSEGPIYDEGRVWLESEKQTPVGIQITTPGRGTVIIDSNT